jgi:hypothetical protein
MRAKWSWALRAAAGCAALLVPGSALAVDGATETVVVPNTGSVVTTAMSATQPPKYFYTVSGVVTFTKTLPDNTTQVFKYDPVYCFEGCGPTPSLVHLLRMNFPEHDSFFSAVMAFAEPRPEDRNPDAPQNPRYSPSHSYTVLEGGYAAYQGMYGYTGPMKFKTDTPGADYTPTGEFSATVVRQATPPLCADTNANGNVDDDGDKLCDSWEETGIDYDANGTVDLKLYDTDESGTISAAEQAKPRHKDLFVEIDYMSGHRPDPAAIKDVVDAFAAAPVDNPDGVKGINLHVQVGDSVHHDATLTFPGCTTAGAADFDELKFAYFGTLAEQTLGAAVLGAKRFSFRYSLWAHQLAGLGTTSGCSELPGNDFVVSLGGFALDDDGHNVGTRDEQAGTFMHELGHALNLHHGGSDDLNCKPNYLSVMSYPRQFAGAPVVGRPLNYSVSALASLDEASLSETAGIGGPAGSMTAFGPPPLLAVAGTQGIDWNRDGTLNPAAVSVNINENAPGGCTGAGTVLPGYNDWANIRYDFTLTHDFADGYHASADSADEVTYEQAAAMSPDTDGDGVTNIDDNCMEVANPGQADADGDGVGDACPPAAVVPTPDPTAVPTAAPTASATAAPTVVPHTPALPACRDTIAPASVLNAGRKGVALSAKGVLVAGKASDRGCAGSAVARVAVSIALKKGKRCRFLSAKGKLSAPASCVKPRFVTASGTDAWTLKIKGRLPRGTYLVRVAATDRAGNAETAAAKANTRTARRR